MKTGSLLHRFCLILAFLFSSGFFYGQSVDKAFRSIEKGEFDKALEILKRLKSQNQNDVNTNIGLASVYSADQFPGHNYFLAWQHAITADNNFTKMEEKDKEILNEFLYNLELHKSSYPVKRKFDNMYQEIENKLIKYVREEKDLAMVNEFIDRFPNSKFYENVLHIRNYLEFGKASETNTIESYEQFMQKFPDAAQIPQAVELRDILAYTKAKQEGTLEAVNWFIKTYPSAPQVEEAIRLRNEIAFNNAKKVNTIEALAAFVKDYPDAVQAPAALKLKRGLVYEKAKQVNSFEAYTDFIKNYPEGEQFVDVFNLRANALAYRYVNTISMGTSVKTVWSRAFDFSGNNDIPGGLTLGSGGEVICSGSSSAGESGFQEGWIMKLSADGKLVWNKTFPANQGSHIACLQSSSSGDIYFAGYSIVDIAQAQIQGWIGKVNTDGFKYFDRTVQAIDITRFLLLKEEELAITGYQLDSVGQPKYYLELLKENGKSIWSRKYTTTGIPYGINAETTGNIFIAGGQWNFKTNHAGYITLEYFSENKDSLLALSCTTTGDMLCAGLTQSGMLKSIRLNKVGKQIAGKIYPDMQNFHFIAQRQGTSGEMWLGGTMNNRIHLLKISETGILTDELSFSPGPDMQLADFMCLKDGGYLLLLSDRSPDTNGDVILLKLLSGAN